MRVLPVTLLRWCWYVLWLGLLLVAGCATGTGATASRSDAWPQTQDVADDAPAPGGDRGVVACDEDQPCYAEPVSLGPDDLTLEFLRVALDGSMAPLKNGALLRTGARFTILVYAARSAHVYLFHRDPVGRVDELVRASGVVAGRDCTHYNRLSAGQAIQLPEVGEYYSLRGSVGVERVQPVISPVPLCDADARAASFVGNPAHCAGSGAVCLPAFSIRHTADL